MARYIVVECQAGIKNLRKALNEISANGGTVVSVVPNTGGALASVLGSGQVHGLMIVVEVGD